MTEHIFTASGLEDLLMTYAQQMTLLPTEKRLLLLAKCYPALEKMRQLNQDHFQASPFITEAIEEAQTALEQIAHLGNDAVTEDKSDGEGNCSVCGTPLTKFKGYSSAPQFTILCGHCDKPFMAAKAKLSSVKGFRTVFI